MKYKLYFPTGYKDINIQNDNVDINIVMEDNSVYFATLFTIENIVSLMERNNDIWFWTTDMVIVKDLELLTIKNVIEEIIIDECLDSIASKIGSVESVFNETKYYSTLNDWKEDAPQIVFGVL